MANFTTPITRALNKQFAGRCPRIQAGAYGSFLSIRIEDPDGVVSCKLAAEIVHAAHDLWFQAGMPQQDMPRPAYHMGGVVANWSRG